MRRAVVIAVCVQAWTGCVALPEEAEPAAFDAAMPDELVLDGGEMRPPLGQPYRGPQQCSGQEPLGDGGAIQWPSQQGDASLLPPGDDGGFDLPDPPPTAMDAGVEPPPAMPRPERAGDVLITEIMLDPKGRTDADGEWIELWNASESSALSLEGCALDDGAATARKLGALRIEPQAFATVGRADPGFSPDLVASITLTNTSDTVALLCGGVEIDRVSYDGTFALKTGASLSLDPEAMTPLDNDDPASWCTGVDDYGGDLGTPGAPNPSCAASDGGTL